MSPAPPPRDREEPGDLTDIEPEIDPAGESHVRSILAGYADTGPMPADIAVRLSAALAAAADVEPLELSGARSLRRRRLARVPGGLIAVAATSAVLLGGIGIGLSELGSGTRQDLSTAADGGGSAGRESAQDQAGQPGGGQSGGGQSGADASVEANATEEDAGGTAARAAPATISASGRDYDPASLPGAAALLLARSPAGPDAGSGPVVPAKPGRALTPSSPLAAPLPASIDRLRDAVTLGICASALAGDGSDQVLAADLARFQGEPAAVIVLPGPTAAEVDVWVVGPGCAPGNEQVRARQRIPRP